MAATPQNQNLINEERLVIVEINKWSTVEEQVLRQKRKATWITSGDANTKYCHAQLKVGAIRNSISSIYTEGGIKPT